MTSGRKKKKKRKQISLKKLTVALALFSRVGRVQSGKLLLDVGTLEVHRGATGPSGRAPAHTGPLGRHRGTADSSAPRLPWPPIGMNVLGPAPAPPKSVLP